MRAAELTGPPAPSGSRKWLGWIAASLFAVTGVAAIDYWRTRDGISEATTALDPARLVPGYGPRSHAAALTSAQAALAGKRALLASDAGSWLRMEGVGRALLARGRLTADADDLYQANRVLGRAIDAAPWPAGPVLSRAGAALMIHDLATAEKMLARFDASISAPTELDAAEARGMRCEIAYERGALATARALCGDGGDLGLELRQANMALAGGDAARAARIVDAALAHPGHSPLQLATLMLQRTAVALATGDWSTAGTFARGADRAFPGYWLAEAFVAQQRALEGDVAGAEAAYRRIAERTDNPDVWGALVGIASERGDEVARRGYLARAGAAWQRRVALLPDTYAGHFAEYLALTGAIDRAVAIAGGDYAQRPYLPVITGYAIVLDQAGRPRDVLSVVEGGAAAGFRTPTLLMFRSEALRAVGRQEDADRARREALALNPRIEHPRQAFVHFRLD